MDLTMASLLPSLGTSWVSTTSSAALFGILLHQAIRNLEVDSRGWEMSFTYLGALVLIFAGLVVTSSLSIILALLHTWLAGSAFLLGLYGSILVYRALFHRLCRFPGPFPARLSNLYQ